MRVKTVYTEITTRCNLNCRTCYNRSGLNRQTVEVSADKLRGIVSLFEGYGAKRFLISGGEPTLHSDFNAILDIIEERPDLSFGFVTNGTCRNARFIELLNTRENVTLQISLDGSCEKENSKTRGAGHFERTMEFVRMMKNPSQKPLLKMVISRNNLSDVESFYRMAVAEGCIPEYAFIYKSGNGSEDWESKCLSAQEKVKVLTLVDRLNSEHGISAFLPRCTSKCPYASLDAELSICIKSDGSIQPCQALYAPEYTLGNAFDFDAEAFELNARKMLNTARERTHTDFGCEKCLLKNACGHGCMAEAANLTGDPLGNDDGCLYRKLQFLNYDLRKQI